MRPILTLLILLFCMNQIHPLGQQGLGAETLLGFGFLILAASTVGEIALRFALPRVVGYMAAGLIFGPLAATLFGPGVIEILPPQSLERLAPVSTLAISMIAFLAGAELRWSELRPRIGGLLKILSVELLLTYFLIAITMFALAMKADITVTLTPREAIGFSLLFASIAAAHSPAATLAILSETGARGPVARSTLGVVLLSDVAVVILFSISAAVARSLAPPTAEGVISAGNVVWEIFGAILVGGILGVAIAGYVHFVRRELLLFGVLIAFLGGEIARLAHVEVLLTLLIAGFLTENLSRENRGEALRHAVERAAAPIFVVFFALAGAAINLRAVAALIWIVVPIVLVRAFSIYTGVHLGARWGRVPAIERKYLWLGLVSQAGVAIGLARIVAEQYPVRGAPLQALLLATIAINQIVGPIVFRRALVSSGEVIARDAGNGGTATLATEPAH